MPSSTSSSFFAGKAPTRSVSASRSRVTSCETLATESLGESGGSRAEQDVAGRLGPAQVAGERDADDGGDVAAVEGVTLDDDDGAPEAGLRARGLGQVGPPDLALGGHQSLRSKVRRAAARGEVAAALDLVAEAVEGLGDALGGVAGDVLAHGVTVEAAARLLQLTRQLLGVGEQVVGYGDGCLHTVSITRTRRNATARGKRPPCAPDSATGRRAYAERAAHKLCALRVRCTEDPRRISLMRLLDRAPCTRAAQLRRT